MAMTKTCPENSSRRRRTPTEIRSDSKPRTRSFSPLLFVLNLFYHDLLSVETSSNDSNQRLHDMVSDQKRNIGSSLKAALADIGRWRNVPLNHASSVIITLDLLLTKLGFTNDTILRTIQLRPYLSVTYRRNKGDKWSLREVFLDECYRQPPEI